MILHIICSFLNEIIGKIPISGTIDKKTINHHDFHYQCSKDGPEFLFGNLKIRDCKDEPYFPTKGKLLSCEIKMKTMFKKNNGEKKKIQYENA